MVPVYVNFFGVVTAGDIADRIEVAYAEQLRGSLARWFDGIRATGRLGGGPIPASAELSVDARRQPSASPDTGPEPSATHNGGPASPLRASILRAMWRSYITSRAHSRTMPTDVPVFRLTSLQPGRVVLAGSLHAYHW